MQRLWIGLWLILDIFAARASTSEGKIQVELAQLKYRQTRLAGFGTAMSRLGGGIGTRGPGEKKLEMDRRLIKNRIALLNRELKSVKQHREVTREKEQRAGFRSQQSWDIRMPESQHFSTL